jgi:tRNA/tmRNA/rRNA uracil-C5-methylase (TrmA/RlmC/RlmD family)
MVPYGIPDETVRVTIVEDRKDYCIGAIVDHIETSPSRIAPSCPHFTICGGCDYLHLDYTAELDIKKSIVIDSLSRIGGVPEDELPEVQTVAEERFHYRSHATLKASSGRHGFYRKGSNELVAIDMTGCLLLARELNEWIMNRPASPPDYRAAIDEEGRVITSFSGDGIVRESVCGFRFSRGVNCFFQANRLLRPAMLEIVRQLSAPSRGGTLLDIGCGVGFLTIPCGIGHGTVWGIDREPENVRWAQFNMQNNNISGIDFISMPSSRLHPARHGADLVIVDPPRARLDRATRRLILAMNPARLVSVSCNPSTFARDVRDFASGGYRLESLTMIDMFPGTRHIELIGLLTREASAPTP